ncbi:fimbrial biogenesis chaperone [Vibrio rumoiensis]|uniref:Molecular chaperone n=1 Tax=Vibrio rumoiensis TaxID=76258 RepID=A0ABW7IVN2_9VIBR
MFKFFVLFLSFFSLCVNASVVLNTTRVIYYEKDKEVSVSLTNKGSKPVLIQSWIDDGDAKKSIEDISVPFVLTPPINRIDSGKGQTLRIINIEPLDKGKETMFWLNVLEIPAIDPSMKGKNYMQMAFRTRVKLFYRPSGLTGFSEEVLEDLDFVFSRNEVKIYNPSPYHLNISDVKLYVEDKVYTSDGIMIAPRDDMEFIFEGVSNIPKKAKVVVDYINDFGAIKSFEKTF